MLSRPDVSLGSRPAGTGVVLIDHACDACAECRAGARLWCRTPVDDGRVLTPELPTGAVASLVDALLAVAGLDEVRERAAGAVLVLSDPEGATAVLVRRLAVSRVVVATDPKAARAELAAERTGRAAIVVTAADCRTAVRAVRRGGHVCVTNPNAILPSVTELVQREVTLVSPRDVARVAVRIDIELWATAASAA
jgi:D-arabinose 1-dehydrogenase-like Zn-dependent alcohol dehydrogenase